MNNCKKCGTDFTGNFCSNCGTPSKLPRLNGRYILNEIGSVVNFEKGIFYTIRELILRPVTSIQKFIDEDRNRLVKPLVFLIICSLIYSFPNQLIPSDPITKDLQNEQSTALSFLDWLSNNDGYANIILVFFVALWVKLFFRKYTYTYFEILTLLFYIAGIQLIINTIFDSFELMSGVKIPLHRLVAYIYSGWVIGSFFAKGKINSYLLGFLAQILGAIVFIISMIGLAVCIDFIKGSISY